MGVMVKYCVMLFVKKSIVPSTKRNVGSFIQTASPPEEDCPICKVRLPTKETGKMYHSCCGKVVCKGCIHKVSKVTGAQICPSCNVPAPTTVREVNERNTKRMEGHGGAGSRSYS